MIATLDRRELLLPYLHRDPGDAAQDAADRRLVEMGVLPSRDFERARRIETDQHGRLKNKVKIEVHDRAGRLKALRFTYNLRTNDGIDWQARVMGGGPSSSTLAAAGFQQTNTSLIAITAPTSTTVGKIVDTNTNISSSTAALNQFIGSHLVMGNVVAHIVGNKASATNTVTWYFDQWFAAGNPAASVAAPSAGAYSILAGGSSAFYVGLATNSGSQAATDHLIGNITSGASAEIGSGLGTAPAAAGLGRVFAAAANSWAHTAGAATYQLKNVFTASGTFAALQQCGMFTGFVLPGDTEGGDLTNAGQGGGVMAFENTFSSVNMISGDTLTVTWTVNY